MGVTIPVPVCAGCGVMILGIGKQSASFKAIGRIWTKDLLAHILRSFDNVSEHISSIVKEVTSNEGCGSTGGRFAWYGWRHLRHLALTSPRLRKMVSKVPDKMGPSCANTMCNSPLPRRNIAAVKQGVSNVPYMLYMAQLSHCGIPTWRVPSRGVASACAVDLALDHHLAAAPTEHN